MSLKVRKSRAPPPPPGCPMAACMAVLGGAWTPSLIWKLSGGPRRFGELQRDIPGISPKMLAARLRDLGEKGVVVREVVPSSPPSVEYSLSELGRELMNPLGRQIESEQLDGDEAVALGIVGAEHRARCAGTNLMENPERSEGVWRRRSGSVRVQRKLLGEGGSIVTHLARLPVVLRQ